MKTQNKKITTMKKLIKEDAQQVNDIRQRAKEQIRKICAASELENFVNEHELKSIIAGCPEYNVAAMRRDKLSAQMIDRGIPVPTPGELVNREEVLKSALNCFEFAELHEGTWKIDLEKLETACDRFRKYITEPYQFRLLKFMEDLCAVLNGYPIGENARGKNFPDNRFANFNRRLSKWEPVLETLFTPEGEFKN